MQPKLPKGRPSTSAAKAAGPHQKAACRARCCVVHPSLSICPTSPEHHRTQDPVARQPWIAPVIRATSSHGPSVRAIRRRCRTDTALAKPAKLRRRLLRFPQVGETLKKLFQLYVSKGRMLLSTSHAFHPLKRRSGVTGAIARCKRVSTGCGRTRRSVCVLRWICGVKPTPKAVNKTLASLHRARAGRTR